jgi:PAS domain S-box-containing protein
VKVAALFPDARTAMLEETERVAGIGSYRWRAGVVTWSTGMYRILGLSPTEKPTKELFFSLIHPEDLAQVRASYERVQRSGGDLLIYRIVRKDGEVRWIRGQGAPYEDADGIVIHGVLADITESRRTNEALGRANALLAEAQRAAGVGSFTWDVDTGAWQWSDELYRMTGIEPSIGHNGEFEAAMVDDDERQRWTEWTRSAATEVEPPAIVVRLRRPEGEIRVLEARGRRIGGVGPVMGVMIDITERVQLEDQLRHAVKMEAVGDFAAGVAHDFNNALTVLSVHLDLLRERGPDRIEATAAAMRHAVEQCAALTHQLLAFARKQPAAPVIVDAVEMVRAMATLVERVVGPDIAVETRFPGTQVRIRVDAAQLDGALMNLVVNARDAMPDGGRLSLEVDVTSDEGRITVRDNGTGISAENLTRIFDPYFSTKAQGRGSGLGLASVYATVRQHGGSVEVESVVGMGTAFHLVFPLSTSPVSMPPERPARGPTRLRGTILVVEDVDAVRALACEVLAGEGWRVLSASDGLEAQHLLEGGASVDVLLTDIRMPRMDGIALIRRVRTDFPTVRVVAMTGFSDRDAIADLDVAWVAKPFDVELLVATVDSALREGR